MKQICGKALEIAEKLNHKTCVEINDLEIRKIPKKIGIYLWRDKENKVVYVGIGLGKNGLRQRLVKQHLRSSYTKSVLRIKVANENKFNLREECVDYIIKCFRVAYLSWPEEELIKDFKDYMAVKIAEFLLITEHKPKYNSEYNKFKELLEVINYDN